MEEKQTRKVSTIFDNKSGTNVSSAVLKLVGAKDSYHYSLTNIILENGNKTLKLVFDLSDLYNKMNKYNLVSKMEAKLNKKFMSFESFEQNVSDNQYTISFTFNDEDISTIKLTIKYLKKITKFVKTLKVINEYCNKLIEKKELRIQELAKKKAEKAALKKEAAEAIVESESIDPSTLA